MFIVDGKIITPALSGTILDGITRESLLRLARKNGITVEERRVSLAELTGWFDAGKKVEAFGAGTAAVIAPIEMIDINGKKYSPYMEEDATMFRMKKELNDIKYGVKNDEFGWNYILK